MSGSSGIRSLHDLVDHELDARAVARPVGRLAVEVARGFERLAARRQPRDEGQLREIGERSARQHRVAIAQHELARHGRRRRAQHRDRRPAARRAGEYEERRIRAELAGRYVVAEPYGDRDLDAAGSGGTRAVALACRKLRELRLDDPREIVRNDPEAEQTSEACAGRGVITQAERTLSAVPER